eukprot:Tbor_TRINITY_DN5365_c1_g2::TRINITY_DN5365_c1_g2_i1::g.4772::m.4772
MNPDVLLGPVVDSCPSGAITTTTLVAKMSDCREFFNKELIATLAEEGRERMERRKRLEINDTTPKTCLSNRVGNKRHSRSPPFSTLDDTVMPPTQLRQSYLECIKLEPSFSNPTWASDELERLLAEEALCDPTANPCAPLVLANKPTHQIPLTSSCATGGQSSCPSADHRTKVHMPKYVLAKELRRSVWTTATPDRAVWCPPAPATNSSSTSTVIVGGKRKLVGCPISRCPFKTFLEDAGSYRLKNW